MAEQEGMIEPFAPDQVRMDGDQRLISYGTSSYGYDVRCSREFKVFTNIHSATVDPKRFDEDSFVHVEGDVCVIPPNSFALACTVEYFRIPRNVLTICLGKSTYARCGIIVNVTPLEPEWEGPCDAGVLKYDHLTGKNLCQRRRCPDAVLRIR
jgi:dCTP deaminase